MPRAQCRQPAPAAAAEGTTAAAAAADATGTIEGVVSGCISVLVAVLLSLPFLALLFGAAAEMISIASNRALDPMVVMWALAIAVVIISTLGGLRGIAQSGPLQMTMVVVGVGLAGLAAYHMMGGFVPMKAGLAQFAQSGATAWGTTAQHGGGDYNAHFALSGVVQWTHGIGRDVAPGSPWTSALALTFVVSLLGW